MKHFHFILLLFLFSLQLFAQDTLLISKASVLEQMEKQNLKIRISEQELWSARGQYRQTNGLLLPSVSISHTGITTTNPLMAFGSRLNQQRIVSADFNPDLLNNPERIEDFATRVEVSQPLINMDGFSRRKAAKAQWEAASLNSERTREYMVLEVEKAYMELQLAYKTIEVLQKAKRTVQRNLKQARDQYKQGLLQKSDILAVEVRAIEVENQLQSAESQLGITSNYLSMLMNDTGFMILKPSDSLEVSGIPFEEAPVLDNRKDIRAMEAATRAYKQQYQAEKMNFLPRLNAFGVYELHDQDIFQGAANGYLIGAELKWDVLQGTKRFGKAQSSKADYEKSRLELAQYKANSQVELNRARRMLQDAQSSLELTTLALEQSREALRIRTNRYKQGLEKTSDLLAAESQYAQKELEYYINIFQLNYSRAYLHFLTRG
ncbi:TolC family protein [Lentiprolixibacter aurantiacus]|uniref:TolC family protein n=1 Tax=Lentiprolixibacter aurantiacus TaxID=2993939 RepID=A0AAE3SPK1_9FLAO|nr:TolC family protein [Lentiprolixibacter aurantiacus]MCX2720316.1 TolC family protein [Lentiprolixibacter aurantiacus]